MIRCRPSCSKQYRLATRRARHQAAALSRSGQEKPRWQAWNTRGRCWCSCSAPAPRRRRDRATAGEAPRLRPCSPPVAGCGRGHCPRKNTPVAQRLPRRQVLAVGVLVAAGPDEIVGLQRAQEEVCVAMQYRHLPPVARQAPRVAGREGRQGGLEVIHRTCPPASVAPRAARHFPAWNSPAGRRGSPRPRSRRHRGSHRCCRSPNPAGWGRTASAGWRRRGGGSSQSAASAARKRR